MYIDISFEYDCAADEFIYDNVEKFSNADIWVSFHTEFGKHYLETNISGNDVDLDSIDLHERFIVDNDLAKILYKDITMNKFENKYVSCSWGGFYWNNKEHSSHTGK